MRKVFAWAALLAAVLLAAAYVARSYMLHQAREPILARLNDPDSAQFRNERFIGGWTISGAMCGEVNAKNRMGGYTGYVKYYTVLSGGVPVDSHVVETGDPSGETMFEDLCIVQKYWNSVWGWLYW
ncbi:hypothetical protein EGY22_13065 [Alcaligenes faecalis]|nr:hypothetical protein CPY64_07295 [Alcaligenes faecalis]AYZ92332.1 hypothetical protein EGY22_13065 [Alcaligenes faecalis]CAJ0903327.1 Secreted protein [Alcaligenes faecalis subsp. faecalis]